METVGSAGDWDKENGNHGPAFGPLLGWQKFCPGWEQSLIGKDPKSRHQQETPYSFPPGTLTGRQDETKEGWPRAFVTVVRPNANRYLLFTCSPDSSAVTSDQMIILGCSHKSQSHDQISLIIVALDQQLLYGEMSCCYILFKLRKSSQPQTPDVLLHIFFLHSEIVAISAGFHENYKGFSFCALSEIKGKEGT